MKLSYVSAFRCAVLASNVLFNFSCAWVLFQNSSSFKFLSFNRWLVRFRSGRILHAADVPCAVTPSLPQPVKFPGCKLHERACKQYVYFQVLWHIHFQCYAFWSKSFHMPVQKRRQKGLMISNFTLLLAVFKWHHGTEGVNTTPVETANWGHHALSVFHLPSVNVYRS